MLLRSYFALAVLYDGYAQSRRRPTIYFDWEYNKQDTIANNFGVCEWDGIQKSGGGLNEQIWRDEITDCLKRVKKDLQNKQGKEMQANLNQHQTDIPGDNLQPDKVFLSQIAVEVEKLVINSQNMDTFRQKIKPFVERWEQHNKDTEIAKAKLKEHWQKVKNNPAWQDKKSEPPQKGWEWDRFYLFGLGYLSNSNPMAEMPAKYAPAVITAIEKHIKETEEQKQRYVATSREYQAIDEAITEQRINLADIHSELDMLNAKEKKTAWIKTPPKKIIPNKTYVQFQWWRWINLDDEGVFGCWRPPLKKIRPNPLIMLISERETGFLPKPTDTVQEHERYYVALTSIHDNMLPGVQSISNDVWSKELAEHVWFRFTDAQPYGPDKGFIKAALERIQAVSEQKKNTETDVVEADTKQKYKKEENNYIKKGSTWQICFDGKTVPINGDLKGLPLIAYLLQNPGKSFSAFDLEQGAIIKRPSGKAMGISALDGSFSGQGGKRYSWADYY